MHKITRNNGVRSYVKINEQFHSHPHRPNELLFRAGAQCRAIIKVEMILQVP